MSFSRRFNRRPTRIPAGRRRSGPDTTIPVVQSAATNADGTRVILTYNESLDPASGSNGTYTLANTASVVASIVSVAGNQVTLATDTPILPSDTGVTVDFTAGANTLKDLAGNVAANFSALPVTNNNTGDVTGPQLTGPPVIAADGLSAVLTFDENISGTPDASDFAFEHDDRGYDWTVREATINTIGAPSGATITVTFTAPICQGEPIRLLYTPGATPIEDAAGNDALAFDELMTNNSTEPNVPISTAFWANAWTADSITPQADDTELTTWPDLIGGDNATKASGSTAPRYRTDYMPGDGLPSVEFVAANSQDIQADAAAATWNGVDIQFFAFDDVIIDSVAGDRALFTLGRNNGNGYLTQYATSADALTIARTNDAGGATNLIGTTLIEGQPDMRMVEYDAATLVRRTGLHHTASTNANTSDGQLTAARFTIGSYRRATVLRHFDGRVRCVLLSTNIPTADQRRQINNWARKGIIRDITHYGDSVTAGDGGTSGFGGWRLGFWNHIAQGGYRAEFSGDQTIGAWEHNHANATSGFTISQIHTNITDTLGVTVLDPGMVVIYAGSNNVGVGYNGATAIAAYRAMIDDVITLAPNARILVSHLMPFQDGTRETNAVDFNSRLDTEWASIESANPGVLVYGWDARAAIGGVWDIGLQPDGTHPNQTGYDLVLDDASDGLWQAVEPVIATW